MTYNKKKYHALRRWTLSTVLSVIHNIKRMLPSIEKRTPKWYRLQYKRELHQIKKHIIFMEELMDQAKHEQD
jgi:hypothetical protein